MLISAKHNSVAAGVSEVRSSLSHNLRDCLRKENKLLRMEKDILKKASAFFAKEMK
jgi:transposase